MQSALDGFSFVANFYNLYYTDRLHQSDKGLAEGSMAWLQKACSGQELEDINSYVCGLPPFPGFKLPTYGLDKDKPCTATELSNIFRLLPVALLVTSKSVQQVFLEPIQGEALCFFVLPCLTCNHL